MNSKLKKTSIFETSKCCIIVSENAGLQVSVFAVFTLSDYKAGVPALNRPSKTGSSSFRSSFTSRLFCVIFLT